MEQRGRNGWQRFGPPEDPKWLELTGTVAVGCHWLPFGSHGKQGVCRGLPPVAEGPLPEKEGVELVSTCWPERYFLLQSGHGHWSHPQPVHALRITQ